MALSLLRKVRPLWLREKLFWKFPALRNALPAHSFDDVRLRFAPGVSLSLKPSDIAHQQIVALGYVELELSRHIRELAVQGGLFVDVGANYGYFTALWASARPDNRVVAFEASPRNIGPLVQNVERNGWASRVTVANQAAGREVGRMSFSLGPEQETGWGGLSLTSGGADQVEVKMTTLDEYFANVPAEEPIQALKIDVEGADTWVLEGAVGLLAKKRIKRIFFETNVTRMAALGVTADEAPSLLRGFGYTVEAIGPDEWRATA